MSWLDVPFEAVSVSVVILVLRSIWVSWRNRENIEPPRGPKTQCQSWLIENGYDIVQVNDLAEWTAYIDSDTHRVEFLVDFIVRKYGKYYAVKVRHHGDPELTEAELRREWYPLTSIFGVSGAIYIDVEYERVQYIEFEIRSPRRVLVRRVVNRSLWFTAGLVVAVALMHQGVK